FLSGHPLDDYAAPLRRLRTQSWADFARAVRAGATAGKVAGYVVARTERRTRTGGRMGIVGLSDPSGHYEVVIFAEGLQQYRELLERGRAVLLFLSAEQQGDEVRARIQSVEPLEQAAEKLTQGLRVFMRSEAPLDGVARRLEAKGDGEVSVVVMLAGGTEVEVRLPGRFKVSPQIAGAIKAVPGVVAGEAGELYSPQGGQGAHPPPCPPGGALRSRRAHAVRIDDRHHTWPRRASGSPSDRDVVFRAPLPTLRRNARRRRRRRAHAELGRRGRLHMPVCGRRDATAVQQCHRHAADVSAGHLPTHFAVAGADRSANDPSDRHVRVPASAGLQSIRELPLAAGLSLTRRFQEPAWSRAKRSMRADAQHRHTIVVSGS